MMPSPQGATAPSDPVLTARPPLTAVYIGFSTLCMAVLLALPAAHAATDDPGGTLLSVPPEPQAMTHEVPAAEVDLPAPPPATPLAPPAPAPTGDPRPRLALVDLATETLEHDEAQALSQSLWTRIHHRGRAAMLPREPTRRWLIRNDLHPNMPYHPPIEPARIADALRVDYLVTGHIDRVAETYALELSVYDARSGAPAMQTARLQQGDLNLMLAAMDDLAAQVDASMARVRTAAANPTEWPGANDPVAWDGTGNPPVKESAASPKQRVGDGSAIEQPAMASVGAAMATDADDERQIAALQPMDATPPPQLNALHGADERYETDTLPSDIVQDNGYTAESPDAETADADADFGIARSGASPADETGEPQATEIAAEVIAEPIAEPVAVEAEPVREPVEAAPEIVEPLAVEAGPVAESAAQAPEPPKAPTETIGATPQPDGEATAPTLVEAPADATSQDQATRLLTQALKLPRGDERLAALDEAARLDSANIEIHRVMAGDAYMLGRFDRSLAAAQAGLEQSPDNSILLTIKSSALYEMQRYPEALEASQGALEADPANNWARYNMALALMQMGDSAAEREAWSRYLDSAARDPEHAGLLENAKRRIAELDRATNGETPAADADAATSGGQ